MDENLAQYLVQFFFRDLMLDKKMFHTDLHGLFHIFKFLPGCHDHNDRIRADLQKFSA